MPKHTSLCTTAKIWSGTSTDAADYPDCEYLQTQAHSGKGMFCTKGKTGHAEIDGTITLESCHMFLEDWQSWWIWQKELVRLDANFVSADRYSQSSQRIYPGKRPFQKVPDQISSIWGSTALKAADQSNRSAHLLGCAQSSCLARPRAEEQSSFRRGFRGLYQQPNSSRRFRRPGIVMLREGIVGHCLQRCVFVNEQPSSGTGNQFPVGLNSQGR